MARTGQTKKDRALAAEVVWKFHGAANSRAPREVEWDKARKRVDPSYIDKTKVKRAPYTKQGYVYRTYCNQLSNLLQAIDANGHYVIAHATSPDYGSVGDVVTQAIDRQFRWDGSSLERGNEDRMERILGNGLLYGAGIVYCDWMDGEVDWGVRFTNISPWDFFPDWRGQNWYIVRRWINVSDLADMAASISAPVKRVVGVDETGEPIVETEPRDGGRAEKAFKQILKDLRAGKRNAQSAASETTHGYSRSSSEIPVDMNRVDDDTGMESDSMKDPFNARLEILQYVETHPDGVIALIVPGMGSESDDLVLRKERNPYGICPIAVYTPSPIDNEFWGYSLSEIIGSRAEVMDYLERAQIRLIAKNADAPMLHRRSARLPREFLLNPTGGAFPVNDPAGDVSYLAPGIDQALYAFAHNFAKMQADTATGESEARRGQTGRSGSATEAAIAETGGQTNDKLIYRRTKRFIEQVGRICFQMLRIHVTEEKAIPMLGRDADAFLRLRPEYLDGSFEIRFGGSLIGANTQQDLANRNAVAQLYGATGVLDMSAMARKALHCIGEVNPDQYLVQDAGRPKVSAQHENVAWERFGQIPEVHPQDSHVEHLAKHQKAFAAVAQENPNDPRLPLMRDHIMEHWVANQAQQQQPSPGAQGPASPQQAGGAGQPQTLNARTAQIAEMRQQPNRENPGQAPGGVVPNRQVGEIAYGGPQR